MEWKAKPTAILSELSRACCASVPGEKKRIQDRGSPWRSPVAQCKLAILPGASKDEGTLQVEVCLKLIFSNWTLPSNIAAHIRFEGHRQRASGCFVHYC